MRRAFSIYFVLQSSTDNSWVCSDRRRQSTVSLVLYSCVAFIFNILVYLTGYTQIISTLSRVTVAQASRKVLRTLADVSSAVSLETLEPRIGRVEIAPTNRKVRLGVGPL